VRNDLIAPFLPLEKLRDCLLRDCLRGPGSLILSTELFSSVSKAAVLAVRKSSTVFWKPSTSLGDTGGALLLILSTDTHTNGAVHAEVELSRNPSLCWTDLSIAMPYPT
jgi:hypothetical protein